jgi:hypothetical protein
VFQSKGFHLDTIIGCSKREKEFEGVTVRLDGVLTHAPDVREVMIKKLVDQGGKLHIFHSCQMVKS